MVVFETFAYKKIVEDPTQIGVFRCVVKARRMDVVKISHKFLRKAPAQNLCTDRLLLLQDQLILLRLIGGLETLPWKRAPEEVEKHISQRFQIVTAMLDLDGSQSLQQEARIPYLPTPK